MNNIVYRVSESFFFLWDLFDMRNKKIVAGLENSMLMKFLTIFRLKITIEIWRGKVTKCRLSFYFASEQVKDHREKFVILCFCTDCSIVFLFGILYPIFLALLRREWNKVSSKFLVFSEIRPDIVKLLISDCINRDF
jgi:hypothetical protein